MKKIIKIKGGLGNQLFQYAYGRNLISKNKSVVFDTSFFNQKNSDIDRPFLLDKFNIYNQARFENLKENILSKYLKKIISKITSNHGFYQSEEYFKNIENIIKKEFTLKDKLTEISQNISNQIKNAEDSVSIHVRGGDYVANQSTNKYHGTCTLEYYKKAISYIKEKVNSPTFFIFSDDIEWVKNNLKTDNVIYVSSPNINEYEELVLMSQCEHNIIANSTFSWWGAWLNSNSDKIVIAPKQWTNKRTSNELNILPKLWIQL